MPSIHNIRSEFPLFRAHPDIAYLDSAATSLKPQAVIDAVSAYYTAYSANIHRGVYNIAEKASEAFEEVRGEVADFIGCTDPAEVVFTKGATESLNLIASTWGESHISAGDELVTTITEHHANFVPWQQLAIRKGAQLKVIDIDDHFELEIVHHQDRRGERDEIQIDGGNWITSKTRLLTIPYVSNVLGTINPVAAIIREAQKINPSIITIVDASQAAGHIQMDVKDLGCDFLVFSGHKMFGPTGVGVLWGKKNLLEEMPPYQFGGDMIREVAIEHSTWNDVPYKFEAGTPPIAEVIGLGQAIRFINSVDGQAARDHEKNLTMFALRRMTESFGNDISFYGSRHIISQSGIVTFNIKGIHPHDIAQVLDESDVCVRAGHHCAMPLHTRLRIPASVRASFHMYNTEGDVERLIAGLEGAVRRLHRRF